MRVIDNGNDHRTTIYDGVQEMVDHLRNETDRHDHLGCNAGWSGTASLAEAVELCDQGWEDGARVIEDVLANIKTSLQDVAQEMVTATYYDVAGAYPDMGRFMGGEPECMVQFTMQEDVTSGQVCRLLIDVGASAKYTADWMTRRAGAISAFVQVLTMVGKSVEVWVASPVTIGGGRIHDTVLCVHRAGSTLNVSDIAYVLGHPSMLRHCIFQTRYSAETGYHMGMGSTYGKHLDSTLDFVQPDVVIQRAENEPRNVPDPADRPVDWIRFQLEKLGLLVG